MRLFYFSIKMAGFTVLYKMLQTAANYDDGNENVTWKYYFICATSRLFQLASLLQNDELSRNQIGQGLEYKLTEKMKNSLPCVPVLHKLNLECGHFTLLFCRGRQTNALKCKTHVQSDCICSLNLLFCSVVVAVVFA